MRKLILLISILICFGHVYGVEIPDSILIKKLFEVTPKESIWEKNIGSIITAIISVVSMAVTLGITIYTVKRNTKTAKESLDKQLGMLHKTTIEKEWQEKILDCISTSIVDAHMIIELQSRKSLNETQKQELERLRNEAGLMLANVALRLNSKNPLHINLRDKLSDLAGAITSSTGRMDIVVLSDNVNLALEPILFPETAI